MIADAFLSYFHFTAMFGVFAFLTAEAMLLRNPLDAAAVRLIARIDIWYFAAGVLVLLSGLMRLFWGVKGVTYYAGNPVFHVKVALFIAVGILSFPPTLQILRWKKKVTNHPGFVPPESERTRTRRLVMIELHIASMLPLFAVFMARGIGF